MSDPARLQVGRPFPELASWRHKKLQARRGGEGTDSLSILLPTHPRHHLTPTFTFLVHFRSCTSCDTFLSPFCSQYTLGLSGSQATLPYFPAFSFTPVSTNQHTHITMSYGGGYGGGREGGRGFSNGYDYSNAGYGSYNNYDYTSQYATYGYGDSPSQHGTGISVVVFGIPLHQLSPFSHIFYAQIKFGGRPHSASSSRSSGRSRTCCDNVETPSYPTQALPM